MILKKIWRNITQHRSLPYLVFTALLTLHPFAATNADVEKNLRIGGSGTDIASLRLIAQAFAHRNPGLIIDTPPSMGSSGGLRALAAGDLDIAITSRNLKPVEMSRGLRIFRYARTPLVFTVHIKNETTEINTETLNAIYSGTHLYWKNHTVARPVLRQKSDSDTITLYKHLPEFIAAHELAYSRRGVPVALTDQEAAQLITVTPGAIGTSTLAVIIAEQRPLKALKLNGIEPSIENLRNGNYTLAKDLFIVLPPHPSEEAKKFTKFLSGKISQNILLKSGHETITFKWE